MTPPSFQIEKLNAGASRDVLRQLAMLHREEISGGFLSSLGEGFLIQLYSALASSPEVILLVARRDEEVLGFLCGAVSPGKVYRRFLLRNAWRVAPTLLRRAFSLRTVRRMWETLTYPLVSRASGKPESPATQRETATNLPDPEILNFCVSSRAQRCGIGRKLFAAFCIELADRGLPAMRIVTGAEQHSAQRFYESVGAVLVQETEIHAGQTSLVYVYCVDVSAMESSRETSVMRDERTSRTMESELQPLQLKSES